MTLHHAQEARGRKMKNNFTLFALNITRQSVGDRATDGSGDDCEKTGQSLWMGEESTDTAGTNVGGVEDVNRYRRRKKKLVLKCSSVFLHWETENFTHTIRCCTSVRLFLHSYLIKLAHHSPAGGSSL